MNRQKFISLIYDEQESLRRFLLAMCCGDKEDAEDIAQDALIKAYLHFDDYVPKYKFSTWLFKIAYNTFLDRKKKVKPALTNLNDKNALNIEDYKLSDDYFKYQDLYQAIEQLNEKTKTIILLFYIKGYSIKEIANIIDSTEGAVKTQLSRGRNELKINLEK